MHSNNCFGCASLKRGQYCILNKQYTKEEYEILIPRIIEHMQSAGEWGEFMPMRLSSFAYNESVAYRPFPLTKASALREGLLWRDDDQSSSNPATIELPINSSVLTESFTKEIFACRQCQKNYRLTSQEIKLLKQMNVAPPEYCFLCRHATRIAKRNRETLYDRTCAKCSKDIQTTYSPERPAVRGSEEPSGSRREIVYCEECYLKEVY